MQYYMMYRAEIGTGSQSKESLFLAAVCQPESFFCIIENTDQKAPIGYLGIKDTSKDRWEIAIELDRQYTHRGYGSQSIKLFLNKLFYTTGKTQYRTTIDADNIPSQKCFEGLGANLVGLSSSEFLVTPEDQHRFEERHLDLINDHIRNTAARLSLEPRKLLSHVLEYHIICPL